MIVVTRIETGLWNRILADCISHGWLVIHEYDGFDKGIDSDFVYLRRMDEEMFLGWTNWFEGEIKCTEEQRRAIEQRFNVAFVIHEPEQLTDRLISIHLRRMKG
jgi:hypothetical protein